MSPLRRILRAPSFAALALAAYSVLPQPGLQAQTYIWNASANNNWNNAGNWAPSSPGNGAADVVIDLSTLDIATRAFNLNNGTSNSSRTAGKLIFGDTNTSTAGTWNVNGNNGSGSVFLILDVTTGKGGIEVLSGVTTNINIGLAGSDGLIKTGAGTLNLVNAGNTITGGIELNGGALGFITGSLNNNAILVSGNSNLNWSTAGDTTDLSSLITLSNGVTLTLGLSGGANDHTIFASTLATVGGDTARVTKANGGILTITAVQSWTGGTQINNGRLILSGGDNRLSVSGGIILGNGGNNGILQLGDATGASNQTVTSLARTSGASSTANAIVGGHTTISTLTVNNSADIGVNNSPIFGGAGVNENNLALVKLGAGSLTLSKINTFTGNVDLQGGRLVVQNSSSLGTGEKNVTISGVTNAPSLRLDNAAGITLSSGIRFVTSNDDATNAAFVNVNGVNIINGAIALAEGGYGGGHTRVVSNGGHLTLTGEITAAENATTDRLFILDGTASGHVTGLISDGPVKVSVQKEGTGTWTLTGANTYTGTTSVNGGRLNVSTAQTGGGSFSVGTGTTLGVTLHSSGQQLSVTTVDLADASTLSFDLGAFNNPSAPVVAAGSFNVAGNSTIHITGTGLGIGTFNLVNYSGSIGGNGFAGLTLGNLPARVTAALVDGAQSVQVNISAFDIPRWTGALSGDWDINDGVDPTTGIGTVNWKELNSGLDTRYLQSGSTIDSVLFDDTATGTKNVNLTTTLTPVTLTVSNSSGAANDYTFSGTGKLSGSTSLVKQGTGTLILANTGGNDYTGNTTISGGILQVGDGVTPGAGQLGTGLVINNAALVFNRPDNHTSANIISGTGTLTQQGTGVLTLSGNNSTFDGAILVNAGVLKLSNAGALGSTVGNTTVASGAALDLTGYTVGENVVLTGGTLSHLTGTSSLSGSVNLVGGGILDSAAGTLTLSGEISGNGGLVKNNAGTVTLSHANIFSGGLTVNGGVLILGANQNYTGGTAVKKGTLQIGTSSIATTGNASSGAIDLSAATGDTATLTILRGNDNSLVISNNIITSGGDGINAVIIGTNGAGSQSGIVTFSGVNTFTGDVSIQGGALKITNSSALGLGTKTVNIASNAKPALLLDGSSGDITLDAGIRFKLSSDGTGGNFANNSGSIVNVAGDNTINGRISLVNGGGGHGRLHVEEGTLTMNGEIDGDTSTGGRTLLLGGTERGTGIINGVISDYNSTGNHIVNVTKEGAGTWILRGQNTYTGNTNISGGVLQVGAGGNGSSLTNAISAGTTGDSGTTTLNSGTLSGTGLVQGALNIQGGTWRPGDTQTTAGDQLGTQHAQGDTNFTSGNIALQVKSTQLNVSALADATSSEYQTALASLTTDYASQLSEAVTTDQHDHLEIGGSFSWNTATEGSRTVSVELVSGYTLQAGDVINLLDWAAVINAQNFRTGGQFRHGGESGSDLILSALGGNLAWDTSLFSSQGILVVTNVVPEPGRAILLLLGLVALTTRRSRTLPHKD